MDLVTLVITVVVERLNWMLQLQMIGMSSQSTGNQMRSLGLLMKLNISEQHRKALSLIGGFMNTLSIYY